MLGFFGLLYPCGKSFWSCIHFSVLSVDPWWSSRFLVVVVLVVVVLAGASSHELWDVREAGNHFANPCKHLM